MKLEEKRKKGRAKYHEDKNAKAWHQTSQNVIFTTYQSPQAAAQPWQLQAATTARAPVASSPWPPTIAFPPAPRQQPVASGAVVAPRSVSPAALDDRLHPALREALGCVFANK
jgi:hypothetical protein